MKSGNLNFLEPSGPLQACNGTALPLFIIIIIITHSMQQIPSSQLVKKFPAFYGTRKFITAFTSPRNLSLPWANSIQYINEHHTSWRSILILPSNLRLDLPSGLFLSSFPTKTLYTSVFSPYVLHSPSISFFSIWSPEQYWVSSSYTALTY